MTRQAFDDWGAKLGPRDLADALAGLSFPRAATSRLPATRFLAIWPNAWRDRDPQQLAETWRSQPAGRRTRLGVYSWPKLRISPRWLAQTLSQASGVSSVIFPTRLDLATPWDWPLDLVTPDDPSGRALLAELRPQHWERFVRFGSASSADGPIELLVVPGALRDALASIARLPKVPRVHTVITLGPWSDARAPLALHEAIAAEVDAAAVVSVLAKSPREWLDRLLLHLSHDRTLDEAIWAASEVDREIPLISGAFQSLDLARPSTVLQRVASRLVRKNGGSVVADIIPPRMANATSLDPAAPASTAAGPLIARVDDLGWDSESDSASDLLELKTKAPPETHEPRFVQAELFNVVDAERRKVQALPLHAERSYELEIHIAVASAETASADEQLPEDDLPPSEIGHYLTIAFYAPGWMEEPASRSLFLPPHGESERCVFTVSSGSEQRRLEGRITVLHNSRILQTLIVRTRSDASANQAAPDVVWPTRAEGEEPVLSIEREVVLDASFVNLSHRRGFDASILLNDALGQRGLVSFSGERAAYTSLVHLDSQITMIRSELEKITKNPDDYATTDADATRRVLVTLARAGREMRNNLEDALDVVLTDLTESGQKRRLQIVSLHPDSFVPIEFMYTGTMPLETARLCGTWREGLRTGSCQTACPTSSNEHVCPLQFVGLKHVVERHFRTKEDQKALKAEVADFAAAVGEARDRSAIRAVTRVVIGVADKATNHNAASFAATMDKVKDLGDRHSVPVDRVRSWKDWVDSIKHRPEILVLLGHTELRAGAYAMQLGEEAIENFKAAGELDGTYVRPPPLAVGEPGPIVFLFGCRIVGDDVPNSSFIDRFRKENASVVVGTIGTVRGRHMAPAAHAALELLLAAQSGGVRTLGDVLLDLRRDLLARDYPVGLTFVSFGDVDWQIGGQR